MDTVRNVPANQLAALALAIDREPPPFRLAFSLMLEAGLRLEETRALIWSQLVYEGTPKTAIELTTAMTKNNRARTLPVSAALTAQIAHAFYIVQDIVKRVPHLPVLALPGRRIAHSARQIQRRCKRLGNAALGRALTPHMLRHTFATRLLAVSNVSIVQSALGHRRLSTTQIYLHPDASQLQEAVAAL